MKVVILSMKDYAASGFKLFEAVKRYTDVDIKMYRFTSRNKFGHPQGVAVNDGNRAEVQRDVANADIIHLKGDWPHDGSYCGIDLKNKPIIISVSGSHFRKKEYGGQGGFKMSEYDNCDIKTAMTIDLCYEDFSDIWIPHPIETEGVPVLWQYKEIPLLTHSPSRRRTHNTKFLLEVFEKIKKIREVDLALLEGMSFDEVDNIRKNSTIFFNQFMIGFYSNAAVEAMRYGIPVAAWLSPDLRWPKMDYDCPVFSTNRDSDKWVDVLGDRLRNRRFMTAWSKETREWCENVHSYRVVANKLLDLYNQL